MNIVHISTFLKGGAAIAALKVHNDLLRLGINSRFLILEGEISPSHKEVYKLDAGAKKLRLKSKLSRIAYKVISIFSRSRHEIFTFPFSDYELSNHKLIQEADIIHLHWVAGMVNYSTFFRSLKKPIVWTLHDMNPFSGGFHYEDDELFNRNLLLRQFSRRIRTMKERLFRKTKKMTIVSPSRWLLNASAKSKAFSHLPHYNIPYSINEKTFKLYDKQRIREKFDLPEDGIIFTFLSDFLHNKRKGFEILSQSLKQLVEEVREKVTIINIGAGHCDIDNAINMGRISDQTKIAEILSASDALLLPSREDNFPNVMMEANACGCPVIAFPIGGIKEFINDFENGILARNVSAKALKTSMQLFIRKRAVFNPVRVHTYVLEKYSAYRQASSYLEIYNQLI